MVLIILEAQSKIPCVSFTGTDSSVFANLVSSESFESVVIRLVWLLSEFTSKDTRYRQDVEKSCDPSENPMR